MATTLHVQGADIELDESESFNKLRHRLNKAFKQKVDYENGNIDGETEGQKFDPFHTLSFATEGGGRISVNVEKVIGISSDTAKDTE